jgi:hypothetical protein
MSAPQSSSAVPTNTMVTTPAPANPVVNDKVPSASTLLNAAKISIQKDMPIQLDYFVDSAEGKAFLGEDSQTNVKMLVKNSEEYTSHIQKIYKAGDDYIIMTENSIYLVSGKIQKRKIQSSTLKNEGIEA